MTEYQRVERLAVQAGFSSYQDYLRSQHWRELKDRSGVMLKPCCACPSHSELAHHMRYRNLLDVLPEDLIGMCCECHDDFHMACRKSKQSYIGLPPLQILVITTAFRATPWAAKWKARKAKKRQRSGQRVVLTREVGPKQMIKRKFKRFMKSSRNEVAVKELTTWLLDQCCNSFLIDWKTERRMTLPSLKGNR